MKRVNPTKRCYMCKPQTKKSDRKERRNRQATNHHSQGLNTLFSATDPRQDTEEANNTLHQWDLLTYTQIWVHTPPPNRSRVSTHGSSTTRHGIWAIGQVSAKLKGPQSYRECSLTTPEPRRKTVTERPQGTVETPLLSHPGLPGTSQRRWEEKHGTPWKHCTPRHVSCSSQQSWEGNFYHECS